ncbi:MAG TPA: hypothetical protein VMG31_14040 [Verrucomicrobiae bacterium]|nr:hypothetical protein [Verrucomicrobiae bacterium]
MHAGRFLAGVVLGLAMCLAGAGIASAQQAQEEENGVPAHLIVTVEPRQGSVAPVINRDDVMVYQGKTRSTVTDWVPAQGEHAGLEFFILVDDGVNTSVGSQLDDIRHFIDAQPSTTKIGVAYMQNGIARIQQNLTDDHSLGQKALRLPQGIPGINSSPYLSLSDLIKRWPATQDRREVLMVSDGIDPLYGSGDLLDPYLSASVDDARKAGVIVYAIYTPGAGRLGRSYWASYWGQIYLSQVAEETGGDAFYIGFNGPPVAFAPYLDQVANRLGSQYLLTFLAKPTQKAQWQRVRVSTEVSNADLVSADEVYVTPPKK